MSELDVRDKVNEDVTQASDIDELGITTDGTQNEEDEIIIESLVASAGFSIYNVL